VSKTDVTLRPAEPADAGALTALALQLGHHTTLLSDVRAQLEQPAEVRHTLLVAVLAGRVVGFVELEARVSLPVGRWAELTTLVVEESLRGRGVGSVLVEGARAWALGQGLRRLRVRTRSEREATARFYEKAGFRLCKEQRVYDVEL
jgi:N-acetylglutamate synthase-like GNAT family acetyltransferase